MQTGCACERCGRDHGIDTEEEGSGGGEEEEEEEDLLTVNR